MKLLLLIIAFAAAVITESVTLKVNFIHESLKASAQVAQTTTEDLLSAQNELGIGHEFVETLLQVNRNIISSYIEIVTSQLVDSFMDTYSEIQIIAEFVKV